MRIASTMMSSNYLRQLNKTYEQYTKLMEQSDGSKLHRASDDVVGYSKYLRYQNNKISNEQYQDNVSTASTWMKNADAALVNVTDLLATFKEKTEAAANSTQNESDMKDIAKELLANVQEQVADLNTQIGDRFLFAGQKDTTMPFSITDEKMSRGETVTLDEKQQAFFAGADKWGPENTTLKQMLKLNGDDGGTYYMNVYTGDIFTEDFVFNGYKNEQEFDPDSQRIATLNTNPTTAVYPIFDINRHFGTDGVIIDSATSGSGWSTPISVNGATVNLSFATVEQYIVRYNGDDKYISMVKKNGGVDQATDTVNVTGYDLNGTDLFDVACGGTGTAMLNQLMYTVAKIESGDHIWAGREGMTIADTAHTTVLGAETKMAARQQAYESAAGMLTTQNESIVSDITDVSSTDVAYLATKLMEYQTIYSMSLSVGSKILPGSLADYLN
ncbi:flagellar hook-associated protein 3 [Anaerovibrio slackiae]|uniref:flagellin N-terminal helical domain-containing protein n=1 Tax=Anaerovibrio slackiae TaxID=2652309 RepID=UPI0038660EDD